MATLTCLEGFEHGIVPAATGLFTVVNNAAIEGTIVRTGAYALRVSPTAGTGSCYIPIPGTAPSTVVMRGYVRFVTLPSADHGCILGAAEGSMVMGSGVGYKQSTSQFCCSDYGVLGTAGGPTVVTGQWYRLDLRIVWNGSNAVIDAQVDGTPLTQFTRVNTLTVMNEYRMPGDENTHTFDLIIDDVVMSHTSGDYPLGDGYVLGYSPNAVGAHNLDAATSQYFFKNASGTPTALTTSETTSYQAIDDIPLNNDADRVYVQAAQAATSYCDPNGNGTNTAWTGDYTGIDDGVRSPTNAQTNGDGATISSGTAAALEDTLFGTTTYVAGATYTLYIFSGSGAKRGLSVSVNAGSSFSTIHGASATAQWRTLDVSSQITNQATLDAFAVRWRCDSTAGGGGAGSTTVYAAYLEIVPPQQQPTNTWYTEYGFADSGETTAPIGVRAIVRLNQDVAANCSITAYLRANANNGTIYSGDINSSSGIYRHSTFAQAPGPTAWTDALFDGATLRWGFTNDADGVPRLEAVMLQAAFAIPLTPVSQTYVAPFEARVGLSKTGALSFEALQRISNLDVLPETKLLSAFTGAAENPLSEGGLWTNTTIRGGGRVRCERDGNGNALAGSNVSAESVWAETFNADQQVYATLQDIPAGSTVSVWARIQNEEASYSAYRVEYVQASRWLRLYRYSPGEGVILNEQVLPTELATGDKIALRVIGSRIQAFYQRSGQPWILAASVVDSMVTGPGRVGICLNGGSADPATFTDFGGGNTPTTPSLAFEAIQKISPLFSSPWESVQGATTATADFILPWEARGYVTTDLVAPYEAIQRTAATYPTSFETLTKLSQTTTAVYESLQKISGTYGLPEESRGWVTADHAVSYEAIQRIVSTYLASFEILTKFSQTTATSYESLQNIASTYSVPEESQFALASQKELPYESLIQIGNSWINPWESRATVTYKQTGTARISLEPGSTPEARNYHYIAVRARVTNAAEVGTLRLRLYEGANPKSAELETVALTDSFQTYLLHIDDADAASITSYSDLEVRMYGYSSTGDSADFEVAEIWLQIPTAGTFLNVTFDAPYEAMGMLSVTLAKPWESIIKLTAINATNYESLEGVQISVAEPYEALGGLSATYDTHYESRWNTGTSWVSPFEALQKIAKLTETPYDALGSLSFTKAIPWEALQVNGIIATFELAYEAIGSFAYTYEFPYESLISGITQTRVVPYEALQGIRTLYGVPQDSTGVVQATAVFAYEALKLLQFVAETNYESIGHTTKTYEQPYEALQLLALQTGFPYESLVGLRTLTSVPWEAISISGVLTSFEIVYEALQRLSATTGVPYEAVQKLSSATQAAYESLVGISSASAMPWEAGSITGILADFVIPFESIGWTSAPKDLPYEGLLYLPKAFTYPYESLLRVTRTDTAFYEALQALAQSTSIPFEARGWITNDLTVPYEALQALSAATETPFETLVGLSLTSAIPWESVSQLVGEHILRAFMFSHYYVQMMKLHEAHMFTHLATEPKQHVKAELIKSASYRPRRFK